MSADLGLALLRMFAGISFLYHGYPKVSNWKGTYKWLVSERFPLPVLSTTVLSVGETVGGLFLLLGLFVQHTAIGLAVLMSGAVLLQLRNRQGWKGAEPAATLLIIALVLAIAGGGAWQLR